jgi:23S rRNA (uracil747-C5)-methyltransferase
MKCSFFESFHCRSCELLDQSYESTIEKKLDELKKLFPQKTYQLKTPVTLKQVEHSRSKAKLAVFSENDEITFGFFSKEGTPKALEHCPLHVEGINELLPVLKTFLVEQKIIPYDLKTKRGELKYVLITKSENDYLVRFVLRSKESLDRLRIGVPRLQSLNPAIKVVTANIQPVHQAIIEGDEEIILTKDDVIIHSFSEFKLALGARSFFQVTPEIARTLYHTLSEEIKRDHPASLIDLYCGVGAFSFYASRYCQDVSGVEISKEAIACAEMSNKLNDKKINFQAMDVEEYLNKFPKKYEAVLVNPPRRGLNSSIIENIKKIAPLFIYYSSCNAVTMERDFKEFEGEYEIQSLQLFDMFPYTNHYETLMCLKRK